MQGCRRAWPLLILAAGVFLAGGCGKFKSGDETAAESAPADLAVSSITDAPDPARGVTSPPGAAAVPLSLDLKAGDHFPMMKTIEQFVLQEAGKNAPTSKSRLQMVLAIHVDEVLPDGRKKLRVRYQRVRYSQDLIGEKLEFDSAAPPKTVPPSLLAYQGLVGNGFSFWIGPDHRLLSMVDFAAFLQRCVQHVPEAQRSQVMTQFVAATGDEGIANFIDDSVGLLPHRGELASAADFKPGFHWTRERQVLRPVPIYLKTDCLLKDVNDQFAEISVTGSIRPSSTYGPAEQVNSGLKVTVMGGRTQGECTIERRSGLPRHSRINRVFDLLVTLPDGQEFKQRKVVDTTIQVFTAHGPEKVVTAFPGRKREMRSAERVSRVEEFPLENHPRPANPASAADVSGRAEANVPAGGVTPPPR